MTSKRTKIRFEKKDLLINISMSAMKMLTREHQELELVSIWEYRKVAKMLNDLEEKTKLK